MYVLPSLHTTVMLMARFTKLFSFVKNFVKKVLLKNINTQHILHCLLSEIMLSFTVCLIIFPMEFIV